jgi:hypothetical protein
MHFAAENREDAFAESTYYKRDLAWSRWEKFCEEFELDDIYLTEFRPRHRVQLLLAFAQNIRDGAYSTAMYTRDKPVLCDTPKEHLEKVGKAFRDAGYADPRLDDTGCISPLLSVQWRGYTNNDRATKPEKAITGSVLRRMHERARTEKEVAAAQLAIGAYFFAMRSCEYLKVRDTRRTSLLCIRNIRFFRNGTEMYHDHPELDTADAVTVTFEWQKNDERDVTISMFRTHDSLLCPVRAWSAIIRRLRIHSNATVDTPVCSVWCPASKPTRAKPGTHSNVTDRDMIQLIRAAARDIGKDRLGFDPEELGTHSIRSGAAMAMHLDNVQVYTIMLIGRWSSDAFLRYIRPQVMLFTRNISNRMIKHQHFFSVPTYDPQAADSDPAQVARTAPRFASSRNCGREALGTSTPLPHRTPFNVHT